MVCDPARRKRRRQRTRVRRRQEGSRASLTAAEAKARDAKCKAQAWPMLAAAMAGPCKQSFALAVCSHPAVNNTLQQSKALAKGLPHQTRTHRERKNARRVGAHPAAPRRCFNWQRQVARRQRRRRRCPVSCVCTGTAAPAFCRLPPPPTSLRIAICRRDDQGQARGRLWRCQAVCGVSYRWLEHQGGQRAGLSPAGCRRCLIFSLFHPDRLSSCPALCTCAELPCLPLLQALFRQPRRLLRRPAGWPAPAADQPTEAAAAVDQPSPSRLQHAVSISPLVEAQQAQQDSLDSLDSLGSMAHHARQRTSSHSRQHGTTVRSRSPSRAACAGGSAAGRCSPLDALDPAMGGAGLVPLPRRTADPGAKLAAVQQEVQHLQGGEAGCTSCYGGKRCITLTAGQPG